MPFVLGDFLFIKIAPSLDVLMLLFFDSLDLRDCGDLRNCGDLLDYGEFGDLLVKLFLNDVTVLPLVLPPLLLLSLEDESRFFDLIID